mmetsp:Transcript_77/g.201  ORF Transcript_77/g.201 Transcript_77/m.201 type:complete len:239 (-) Transcript_77:1921-2637(-)
MVSLRSLRLRCLAEGFVSILNAQATSSCTGLLSASRPTASACLFLNAASVASLESGEWASKHSKPEATTTSSALESRTSTASATTPYAAASSPSSTSGLEEVPNKAPSNSSAISLLSAYKALATTYVPRSVETEASRAGSLREAGLRGSAPARNKAATAKRDDRRVFSPQLPATKAKGVEVRPRLPPPAPLTSTSNASAPQTLRSQATMAPYLGAKDCGAFDRSKFPSSQFPSQCNAE